MRTFVGWVAAGWNRIWKMSLWLTPRDIGVTALAGVVYAAEEEKEHEQKIALSTMPPAVQKTIQDNLGGGTITETAKETKEGKTVYQAHIKKSGGEEVEVRVAEDGKLLSVGKEDDQESKD
jgi:hypothetical protein